MWGGVGLSQGCRVRRSTVAAAGLMGNLWGIYGKFGYFVYFCKRIQNEL
jgi:hypothetical protein